MPDHGKYKALLALDVDYARVLKQRAEETKEQQRLAELEGEPLSAEDEWRASMRTQEGFTPELAALLTAVESIQEVSRTLIAVNGGKPPERTRIPRPKSAFDILDLEDERDDMAELSARFNIGGGRTYD